MKENKQNYDHSNRSTLNPSKNHISHPSHQSLQRPFKPSIKVGYVITSVCKQPRNLSKRVKSVAKRQGPHNDQGLKKVDSRNNQIVSGKFQGSEYVSKNSCKSFADVWNRKNVVDAQQRYRNSNQIQKQIQCQFPKKTKNSRSTSQFSSYSTQKSKSSYNHSEGIKDIVEYQHAGRYRPEKVTEKCCRENVKGRFIKFSELHKFDFRKSKKVL